MRIHTPAKINLFLEVLSKRTDGFHEIETLMTAVSLYDTLYFKTQEEGPITVNCRWASGMEARQATRGAAGTAALGDLPQGQDNIVWKALDRFRQTTGVHWGANVALIKRIPSAAGLGGASSDAAASLVAANRVWNVGWSDSKLADFAAQLGSDISFFIRGGNRGNAMAICRGRGEQISKFTASVTLDLVVIKPPVGLSTPAVYRNCSPAAEPSSLQPLLHSLEVGNLTNVGRSLLNRLEAPASGLCSEIDNLKSICGQLDGLGHQLSGSGTSYFMICRHRRQARRVAANLKARGVGQVFALRTVSPTCCMDSLSA